MSIRGSWVWDQTGGRTTGTRKATSGPFPLSPSNSGQRLPKRYTEMPDIMEQTSSPVSLNPHPHLQRKTEVRKGPSRKRLPNVWNHTPSKKKVQFVPAGVGEISLCLQNDWSRELRCLSPTHSPAPFLSVPKSRHHRVPYKWGHPIVQWLNLMAVDLQILPCGAWLFKRQKAQPMLIPC